MAKARKLKQISFSMPNRAGLLSEVTAAIAGAKVNITAICAYEMDNSAYFMLTTDSIAKAKKALAPLGVEIKEEEVVAVEMSNKVGELQKVAKRIADAGININYMYGTTSTGKSSTGVFKTADDKKAIKVINK
ncbi:MAG: ACT domain-containing protein [Nitrospirae bacterium]|nr:ACT domain-containing protein [Nitrospirota bacterium]